MWHIGWIQTTNDYIRSSYDSTHSVESSLSTQDARDGYSRYKWVVDSHNNLTADAGRVSQAEAATTRVRIFILQRPAGSGSPSCRLRVRPRVHIPYRSTFQDGRVGTKSSGTRRSGIHGTCCFAVRRFCKCDGYTHHNHNMVVIRHLICYLSVALSRLSVASLAY